MNSEPASCQLPNVCQSLGLLGLFLQLVACYKLEVQLCGEARTSPLWVSLGCGFLIAPILVFFVKLYLL